MELHQLEYLIAIAEERGFSRAATRLGVSQPSLSQQVKKLEDELGTPLFDRLARRVVPTQAGDRLLMHARRVLAEVADARRSVGDRDGQVTGPLAVGAIPTIAPFLLPRVLGRFLKAHPVVELRIVEDVTDRLVEALARGELDVAIISSYAGHSSIHLEPVASEALRLLVPAKHPLSKRRTVTWSSIDGERLVVLHEMHCLSGQVTQLCRRRGLRPPVVMRGAQLATLAATVASGLGVTIAPAMMAAGDTARDRRYVPFAPEEPTREINVAWNLLRYRSAPSRAFVELLRKVLGKRRR